MERPYDDRREEGARNSRTCHKSEQKEDRILLSALGAGRDGESTVRAKVKEMNVTNFWRLLNRGQAPLDRDKILASY